MKRGFVVILALSVAFGLTLGGCGLSSRKQRRVRRLHLGQLRLFSLHARHVLHARQLLFARPKKSVRLVRLVLHAWLVLHRLNRLKGPQLTQP